MILLLLLFLHCFHLSIDADVPNKSIDELQDHFTVPKQSIENLGRILDQMKRISYGRELVKHGHDVCFYINFKEILVTI